MRKNTRFVPRPLDGTYSRPIGPIPDTESTGLVICEACNKWSREVVWVRERPDQELYPLCPDCDYDPDPHQWGTEKCRCWDTNGCQTPFECSVTKEDYEPVDQAAEKLSDLDEVSREIRVSEADLRKLYARRVSIVKDAMRLDGITATEVAGRLGISRRRVYKMIEQPQGPVSSGPELF